MKRLLVPFSYEDWVEYVFTDAMGDEHDEGHVRPEVRQERRMKLLALTMAPLTLVEYMTRLFDEAASLPARFTPAQVAGATWFIFGCNMGRMGSLSIWDPVVPPCDREACIVGVARLYTDCFEPMLLELGDQRSGDGVYDLAEAVYMIGDGGVISPAPPSSRDDERRVMSQLHVLETALLTCTADACRRSALHAIGHALCGWDEPRHKGKAGDSGRIELHTRLRALLDSFAKLPDATPGQLAYARHARTGMIL